jgi:hypothetical protein
MRATRSLAALAVVMGLASLGPAATDAAAGEHRRIVVTPTHDESGFQDTDGIQQALAACASAGEGCTVQLTAGTYYVKEITALGFQGRLRGCGKGRTVLEVVPPLARSPILVFRGGNVDVSDLTLRAPDAPGTATDTGDPTLLGVVFVRDGSANRFALDRVGIESGTLGTEVLVPDQPTMHIAVWYAGPPTGGEMRIRSCSFDNVPFLLGNDPLSEARITFSHNVISRYYFGVQLADAFGARIAVAHNVAREPLVDPTGIGLFFLVENHGPSPVPTRSLVDVHHNDVEAAGFAGFLFSDHGNATAEKTLRVAVHRNRVAATGVLFGGIASRWVDGLRVVRNVVTGTGSNAVGLGWGGPDPAPGQTDGYGRIVNNDVKDFLVTRPTIFGYGVGPIWLGPQTHHTRVITDEPGLVYDEGVDNRVIGR